MSNLAAAREAVKDALERRAHGVRTAAYDITPIKMRLMGRDEPIARELHERFGDLLALTVAGHPYPFAASPPAPPRVPRRMADSAEYGAEIRTVLDEQFRRVVHPGHIVTGHVEIHNVSDRRVDWTTNSMSEADICDDSGIRLNRRNSKGRGTGGRVHLEPGARTELPFTGSTDCRDLRLGPVLPPGRYQLFVVIPVFPRSGAERFEITCPPIPVVIG